MLMHIKKFINVIDLSDIYLPACGRIEKRSAAEEKTVDAQKLDYKDT